MKYCGKCGNKLNPEDIFCGNCGKKVLFIPTDIEGDNKTEIDNKNVKAFLALSNNEEDVMRIDDNNQDVSNTEVEINNRDNNISQEDVVAITTNKEKNNNSVWKYLLLLLLAVALGIGVWVISKYKNEDNNSEVVVEEDINEEENTQEDLYVEGREVGAIIQTKEEISKTTNELDNLEYLENKEILDEFTGIYNRFSMDMVKNTIKQGENYVSSPLSLYTALGLLSNAACEDTLEELNNALGMSNEEINKAIYLLMKNTKSWDDFEIMHFGNSVWLNGAMGLELNENYRDIVTSYYDSDVFTEDFNDTANTIQKMNDWVSEHTDDAIKDLFSEANVSPATTFVLANALSFDDKWFDEFRPSDNTEEAFHNINGEAVKTEMMHSVEESYWDDGMAKGAYKKLCNGGYVAFILPNEDIDIYDYLNALDDNIFTRFEEDSIFSANETETTVEHHYTNLTIPKFKYDVTLDLKDALNSMGINKIFETDANLSKMLSKDYSELYVDSVIQKATVDLNEEGISAKAATMIGGLGAAMEREIIFMYHDLVLDRPFIYAIVKDGMPCFIGVITNFEGEALSESEIEELASSNGTVTVKVDRLNIRTSPTKDAPSLGKAENGKTYEVLEIKEAEGYTWYKIGDNQWIADDGTWLTYKK